MLRLAGQGKKWTDDKEIRALLTEQLSNGQAFAKLRQMVIGQGGDVNMVDDPSLLPSAPIVHILTAAHSGYISQSAAEEIAIASFDLGAGREKKGDSIDFGVGLEVHNKVGDKIEAGSPLVTIHAHAESQLTPCRARLEQAILISDQPVEPLPLFYGTIFGR
jgi:pyrimidine-nucleoside phosphorylase